MRQLLDELFAEGRALDQREPDHAKRRLNLEPETAALVAMLLRLGRRRRVLEIGTSNGYGTIWLAWAVDAGGGRVVSIDRATEKQAQADANLRRAGLRHIVDLVSGDATAVVANLPGPFDAVVFDADRRSAPDQLRLLLPKLAPDALLLADNALSHSDEIAPYLAAVAALPDVDHLVVPTGKGLSLAHRPPPA
ncbi:MAG: class I SAM-dependent methyltransferase [Chloroflexota bacterium]|nr:class I SAM-dependent methyltransferase [Chloroflexota bacterium]